MFGEIFFIVLLFFVTLIPIVIWGYLFSYFDDSTLNRKRFAVGILAGGLSVFPILYLEDFISKTNFLQLDIFSNISKLENFSDISNTSISFLLSILLFLSLIPFLFFIGYKDIMGKIKNYYKYYFIFSLYLVITSILFFAIGKFFDLTNISEKSYDYGLKFGRIFFNSFKLIVFYYLIIGLIEELSKFFCFKYSNLFSLDNLKQTVLYSIFVALGFAFFENILYFYKIFESNGFGKELIGTYISRNIFSVILHVLCSSIFSYYFGQAYLSFKEKLNTKFIKILFLGFLLSIVLHGLFDIFLTFGLGFFVFIYIMGSYFYITYIFYKQ